MFMWATCRLFRGIYLQKKALQKTNQWPHTLILIDVGNASLEESYDETQRKGNQNFLGTLQIVFNSSTTMSPMATLLSYLKESKLSCRRKFHWHNITKTHLCDVSSALATFVFSSRLTQLSLFVPKWHKDNISSKRKSRDRVFIINTNLLLRQINQRNIL